MVNEERRWFLKGILRTNFLIAHTVVREFSSSHLLVGLTIKDKREH